MNTGISSKKRCIENESDAGNTENGVSNAEKVAIQRVLKAFSSLPTEMDRVNVMLNFSFSVIKERVVLAKKASQIPWPVIEAMDHIGKAVSLCLPEESNIPRNVVHHMNSKLGIRTKRPHHTYSRRSRAKSTANITIQNPNPIVVSDQQSDAPRTENDALSPDPNYSTLSGSDEYNDQGYDPEFDALMKQMIPMFDENGQIKEDYEIPYE